MTKTQAASDRFFVLDYETTGVRYDDVPIEVGVVVTDADFNTLAEFESLIDSHEINSMPHARWADAEQFHGLSFSKVSTEGRVPADVAGDLAGIAREWKPEGGRLILMSDNIQFEWRHTDWLLRHIDLTCLDLFHYCGWDTSALSLFTDFEDPVNTEHRALSDARGLVAELQRVGRVH